MEWGELFLLVTRLGTPSPAPIPALASSSFPQPRQLHLLSPEPGPHLGSQWRQFPVCAWGPRGTASSQGRPRGPWENLGPTRPRTVCSKVQGPSDRAARQGGGPTPEQSVGKAS